VLFNEPKLLKSSYTARNNHHSHSRFSALQRAEIAEIALIDGKRIVHVRFSALQRAEIAEIKNRAKIALCSFSFSALQRAEIAEIMRRMLFLALPEMFQCSSTSRNC
jgi:hypothetical protein